VIVKTLLAVLVLTSSIGAARAEDAKKVNSELLEFLGSIDAEEKGWQQYLEQKPVKPVEKKSSKPAPTPPKPDPKQAKEK
jgi:hypothetical protein